MLNIDELILLAIKNRKYTELNVYRSIKSEILNFKTAKNAKPYNDEEEIKILKKMIKQREDSIQQYKEAGREDLVANESLELGVLEKLIPEPVSTELIKNELEQYCDFELKNLDYRIPKSKMGICIKHLKEMFPYEDGSRLSKIVKQYVC